MLAPGQNRTSQPRRTLSKQAAEGHRARPSAPLHVPQPPSVRLAHPTLDLPGAVGVRLARRGPLALLGIGRDPRASPRPDPPDPGPGCRASLAHPRSDAGRPVVRTRVRSRRPSLPGRAQTRSDTINPKNRESGAGPTSGALRVLRNQRSSMLGSEAVSEGSGAFSGSLGPQDRPGSTISGSRGVEAGRNATARRSAGIRALAANETGDRGAEELLATPRWALLRAVPGAFLGVTTGLA